MRPGSGSTLNATARGARGGQAEMAMDHRLPAMLDDMPDCSGVALGSSGCLCARPTRTPLATYSRFHSPRLDRISDSAAVTDVRRVKCKALGIVTGGVFSVRRHCGVVRE